MSAGSRVSYPSWPLASAMACLIAACATGDPAVDGGAGVAGAAAVIDAARTGGGIHKVKHVIIVMQENHSFDNYFGALAYAPGTPYRPPADDRTGCGRNDHRCVDGLRCAVDAGGALRCSNANLDDDGSTVVAFHDPNRCPAPDLDHGWASTHREVNFAQPNATLRQPLLDGFVRVNDETEQHDDGESPSRTRSPTTHRSSRSSRPHSCPGCMATAST